jgi:hypothetical protein
MAEDTPNVNLSAGLPETILPPEGAAEVGRLQQALARPDGERRAALAAVVGDHPKCVDGWAALGDLAAQDGDTLEAYAYYRVGYHRGLDQLRRHGWRGTGYVRWRHATNRAFLRSLDGLRQQASLIGEDDEQARCGEFLHQLDPEWDRRQL